MLLRGEIRLRIWQKDIASLPQMQRVAQQSLISSPPGWGGNSEWDQALPWAEIAPYTPDAYVGQASRLPLVDGRRDAYPTSIPHFFKAACASLVKKSSSSPRASSSNIRRACGVFIHSSA